MNPLAQDIRRVCLELLPGCQPEGWGNVRRLHGFRIQVSPAGMLPSWIQVAVTRDKAPNGTPVLFFRELDREGVERDERGGCRSRFGVHPEVWLRNAIREALEWVDHNKPKESQDGGPMDFLFQED